jgi:ABC-type multidrug transport system fused ATPase/permease subunit
MSAWRKLWTIIGGPMRKSKVLLSGSFICMIISSASQILEPVVFGTIVDAIVVALQEDLLSTLFSDVSWLFGIWIVLFIITTIFSTIGLYLGWKAANAVSEIVLQKSTQQILGWSRQRFGRIESGRTIKVIDDMWTGLFRFIDQVFLNVVPTLASFFFVVMVGFFIDWRMTLIALMVVPISVGMGVYSWKRAQPKHNKIHKQWGAVSDHINQSIQNIAPVQNFVQESSRLRQVQKIFRKALKQQLEVNVFWALFHGAGSSFVLVARIVIFSAGVYFVSEGTLSLGYLITFLGLINFMLTPMMYLIANGMPRITESVTAADIFYDLFHQKNDVEERKDARSLKKIEGRVEIRGLSFAYLDQKQSTLKNISLDIPSGSSCAFVGPSGAGKSTFVKLLNRTVDPQKGAVVLDGTDIREYTLGSLRKAVGVVTQDTVLFHDTIGKNIRFVKPGATQAEIISACKKAQAHDFIRRLPKGYNSVVGERGIKLSGGERQRLAIARIFLADPPILVLDESTSALDSETEYKLQEVLKYAMKGRTTILIAHRLSTVYLADQIVVMERGRIVDQGDHSELMKKKGLYQRLWNLQSGGYIDR